jgi:hypothetical protein
MPPHLGCLCRARAHVYASQHLSCRQRGHCTAERGGWSSDPHAWTMQLLLQTQGGCAWGPVPCALWDVCMPSTLPSTRQMCSQCCFRPSPSSATCLSSSSRLCAHGRMGARADLVLQPHMVSAPHRSWGSRRVGERGRKRLAAEFRRWPTPRIEVCWSSCVGPTVHTLPLTMTGRPADLDIYIETS